MKQSLHGVEYKAHISEASSMAKSLRSSPKTSANGDDRPRTKEEIQKLFAWWEKEMQTDSSSS